MHLSISDFAITFFSDMGMECMNKSDIVLFETKDSSIILPVRMTGDTVWLNRSQMAELFERDGLFNCRKICDSSGKTERCDVEKPDVSIGKMTSGFFRAQKSSS